MSWWTNSGPNREPDPKKKSKFLVMFGGGYKLYNVKTCTLPSVEVATKEYTLINHKFNYPGIPTWQPVKMTFVDVYAPSMFEKKFHDTSQFLFDILNNSGYYYPEASNEAYKKTPNGHRLGFSPDPETNPRQANSPLTTPEKASTIDNSFGTGLTGQTPSTVSADSTLNRSIEIFHITNDGETSTGWRLVNPIITNISWGDLDYSSDDLVECSLDIKYDWAEYFQNYTAAEEKLMQTSTALQQQTTATQQAQQSFQSAQQNFSTNGFQIKKKPPYSFK